MREEKKTTVSVAIEIQDKPVTLRQEINNHELEEGVTSLVNVALLIEANLN